MTLRETPRFTPDGLWVYRKSCFSSHGTLLQTIVALVETSPVGKTLAELQKQLFTRVHNQVSWLLQAEKLSRVYSGRHVVNLSGDAARAAAQQRQRQESVRPEDAVAARIATSVTPCPEGMRAETVIRLLVQMIATPEASPASLAKKLQAQGLAIQAEPVRRVIATEQRTMFSSLQELREECRRRTAADDDPQQRTRCATVSAHLDRYWDHLPMGTEHYDERITNGIETLWRQAKRTRRRVHGRGKLTQDFQALPPEYMLIQNLDNPRYVELVLGTPDKLAEKLADAGRTAGSFSEWHRNTRQSSLGRLPKRLLRKENSLGELLGYYDDWQEQGPAKAAG